MTTLAYPLSLLPSFPIAFRSTPCDFQKHLRQQEPNCWALSCGLTLALPCRSCSHFRSLTWISSKPPRLWGQPTVQGAGRDFLAVLPVIITLLSLILLVRALSELSCLLFLCLYKTDFQSG